MNSTEELGGLIYHQLMERRRHNINVGLFDDIQLNINREELATLTGVSTFPREELVNLAELLKTRRYLSVEIYGPGHQSLSLKMSVRTSMCRFTSLDSLLTENS